jgi:hypothetical protein
MTPMELVLFIGGAWCVLLGFVVSLLAVASHAEQRADAGLAEVRRRRLRVPGFARRRPERALRTQGRSVSRA